MQCDMFAHGGMCRVLPENEDVPKAQTGRGWSGEFLTIPFEPWSVNVGEWEGGIQEPPLSLREFRNFSSRV